ncbi:MAG: hypothetical protein HY286_12995 [Planctomycetes bacterium]|nr:hypothetical protein [Planctomycetota bacterium]
MAEYSGFTTHTLDDKGRVAIPKPLLSSLLEDAGKSQELAITYGTDQRLYLIASRHLGNVFQQFLQSPFAAKKVADLQSFFFGTMHKCVADKQGRIMLPPHMIQYAKLGAEVTFVGAGNRVEIWSPAEWATNLSALNEQFSQAARDAYAHAVPTDGVSASQRKESK